MLSMTSDVWADEADPVSSNDSDSETTTVVETLEIFADGYESGDTSAWSSTVE